MYEDIFILNRLPDELKDDHYNIVLCSDRKIVDAIFVLMYSLKTHCLRNLYLYILQSDYLAIQKKELLLYAPKLGIHLSIIDIDENNYQGFNSTRLPLATYYYFDLHNILPQTETRALVLDIDTLVLKDIAPLYDIDFEDKFLIAGNEYENVTYDNYLKILNGESDIEKGFLFNNESCFNSGVIMWNIAKFRSLNITLANFKEIVQSSDHGSFFHDQIILNRFCKGQIKLYPRLYFNCCSVYYNLYYNNFNKNDNTNLHEVYGFNIYNSKYTTTIIHFCGKDAVKPWKALQSVKDNYSLILRDNDINEQGKFLKIWWEYAKEIPLVIYQKLLISSMNVNLQDLEYYKRELNYYQNYSNIFRKIIEQNGDVQHLLTFFTDHKYKKIAFFAGTQVVYALIPFLERNNLSVEYVLENFREKPDVIKKFYPRNEKNVPTVDVMIVADIINPNIIQDNLAKYFSFPIVTIFDVINY